MLVTLKNVESVSVEKSWPPTNSFHISPLPLPTPGLSRVVSDSGVLLLTPGNEFPTEVGSAEAYRRDGGGGDGGGGGGGGGGGCGGGGSGGGGGDLYQRAVSRQAVLSRAPLGGGYFEPPLSFSCDIF